MVVTGFLVLCHGQAEIATVRCMDVWMSLFNKCIVP